jgi:hypothetical protein
MATTLQLRRYNTATVAGLTGADGEVFVDTTKKTLVVQDGSTAGGTPLATETFVTSGLASLQTTVSAALVNYAISSNLNRIAFAGLSSVGTSIIPASNLTYSLGSLTRQWKDLYLGTSTLYVGGIAIGVSPGGRITVDGDSAPATAGLEPAGTYWHWNSIKEDKGTGSGGYYWSNVVRAGDYFYSWFANNNNVDAPNVYKYSLDGINWEGSNDTSSGYRAAFIPGTHFTNPLSAQPGRWLSPVQYNKKWIAYGNGVYVLPISQDTVSSVVYRSCYTSTDGTSWTERVNAFPVGAGDISGRKYQYWNAVIWDGSRFLALANGEGFIHNPRLLTSTNGQSWSQISPAAGGEIAGVSTSLTTGYLWGQEIAYTSGLSARAWQICPTDIEYGAGIYIASVKLNYGVAYGSLQTNRVYYSADGASWNYVTAPTEAVWNQIIYGDGVWVMHGYDSRDATDSRRVIRSADNGATWTRVTELGTFGVGAGEALGTGNQANGLSYGDGRWVLTITSGTNGKVLVSTDNAQTFVKTTIDLVPNGTGGYVQATYQDSAYGAGAFVLMGGGIGLSQYSKATVKASIEAPTITVGSGASSITLTTTSGDLVIDGVPLLSSISVSISSALTSYATISSIGSLTTSITSSILFSVSSTYVSVSSLTSSVSFYISSSLTSYVTVSSLSSSVSFYVSSALTSYVTVDTISSYLTSYLTVDTVSSYLTSYVTLDYLSSTLTSVGTVSDLNLSSAGYIIFSGPGVETRPLGPLFSSASIGSGASSILIRTPSFPMASSILNLTTGSTIFADVSSSGTSIQLPFDIIGTPSWVSSFGSSIVNQYQYYQNFGGGSSYTLTSSINTSYTHVLKWFANSQTGQGILYEGSGFNIVSGNLVVYPSIPFVYNWILYETSGSTTSVLLIPITPNTDTQNNWSGNPVYFNNLDIGYTTSSTDFNGSDPGKLVPVPTLGQPTFTENGHQVWPAGWLQTPNNFYLQTSSTGPTFEFTTSGSVVLPTDGQLRNGYPGNAGSSGDGSSWFVTPPSQPGGVASADGEQYIQVNNGVHVEIGTNYTSSSGYTWIFDESGNTIFPTGVTHSSSGSGVKFSSGYDKSFQIETTTTSTSNLWNFDSSGTLTLPVGGDIKNSSGNSVYATNANLTSTLSSYATKTFVTSALTSYTTNANLTSTLSSYATKGPAFSAYATNTLQTITSGSQQKVLFQVEEFDTDNCYASSRFTPTVAGYYQLNAEVRIDGASGTGEMMIVIWKNGSEYKRGTNQSGTQIASNFWAMQVSSLVYANGTGDFFEIYVQQGSGGNLSVTAVNSPNITYFNGCMVRGA